MWKYKIITEKQDNGLWGMPLSVERLHFPVGLFNNNEVLASSIIIYLHEIYPDKVKKNYYYNNGITVENDITYLKFCYDDFYILDNVLYYFENKEEKLNFLRSVKINSLLND